MFKHLLSLDKYLFVSVCLLTSLGIIVVNSANHEVAINQLVFAIIGIFTMFFLSTLDIHSISHFSKFLYIGVIILLIILEIIAFEVRGSARWFDLGFVSFQPSELAKFAMILYLPRYVSNIKAKLGLKELISVILASSPILFLVFIQPDLGSMLSLLSITATVILFSNFPKKLIIGLIIFSLISIPFSYTFLKDYQKQRVVSFLNPASDRLGSGYNVIQSTIAVGSGQLLGRGYMRGSQSHLNFLPEHHTDFIFASYAEEWGFLGVICLFALFCFILMRILIISLSAKNIQEYLITISIFSLFFFQAIVNIGMNLSLAPVTGITLPFFSYGGSSMVTFFLCLGLIFSIAKHNKV